MSTDVLIVGAGPTGLMAASLLLRCGISCRIIDKNPNAAKESRALGIQARSMELFQNLGLVDQILSRGMKAQGVRAYLNGEEKLSADFSDMGRTDTPYPYIFFLSQAETESILAADVENLGLQIERNTTLLDLHQNANGVESIIQLPNGKKEVYRSKYLIGADGSHSVVRTSLNLPFEGGSYPSQFIMSDAKVDWEFDHTHVRLFLNPGSIGVFLPLKNKNLSRVLTIREVDKEFEPKTSTTTSFPASLHEIEENFAEAIHREVKLSDPEWVTKFHVHHRCVENMRARNVFLAGDAAHIHSPAGAQGMNTGFQDVANLCWKLERVLKGFANEEILETYQEERWPVAQKILNVTDRFFSLATTTNPVLIKIRDFLFPTFTKLLMKKPILKKSMFGFISQLQIHYHPNLVAFEGAGKRVPNIELDDGRTIFDLIIGYKFHLLIFEEFPLQETFPETFIHQIQSSFKKSGLILVRPDGYSAIESEDCGSETLEKVRSILRKTEVVDLETKKRPSFHWTFLKKS